MGDEVSRLGAMLGEDDFVRRLARRLIFDRHAAEDVAQEAWLAACRAEAPKRGVRPWFAGVVRRLALKEVRTTGRRNRRESEVGLGRVVPSTAEIQEREEIRRELVESLLGLEPIYRDALLLRFFEDLPPRAVAKRLGVPVETVRTRLKRGLEEIRRRLDRGGIERRQAMGAGLLGLAGWKSVGVPLLAVGSVKVIGGVLAMKASAKLAALGLAILLGGALYWFFGREGSAETETDRGALTEIISSQPKDLPVKVASGENPVGPSAETPSPIATQPFEVKAAPDHGSLLLTVVFARTGLPARRTPVSFLIWNQPDPFLNERLLWTDDEGKVRLDRVRAGALTVSPILGGDHRVKVEAGKETAATIEIPKGGRIEGTVVDASEAPVAEAEICLSTSHGGEEGICLTRSAANGYFRIDDVDVSGRRKISARKANREPTPLVSCSGNVDMVQTVKLVFPGPGGGVSGRVVDSDQQPIAHAKLLIGREGGDQGRLATGADGESVGPELVRTDSEGRFATSGLAPGKTPILARADGFALYRGDVLVQADRQTEVAIVLNRGGRLAGHVRDPEGKPIPRIAVRVNGYGSLESSLVRTAEDGSYMVRALTPGSALVVIESEKFQRFESEASVIEGGTTPLEITLTEGMKILGRLVDEAGAALEGFGVSAEIIDGNRSSFESAKSDAEGRFVFRNCRDAPYGLTVWPKGGGHFELKRLSGVRPGPDELRIVVEGARLSPAAVSGRVVDENGKPLGNAEILTLRAGMNTSPVDQCDGASGEFRIERLTPGVYRLSIRSPGYAAHVTPKFELSQGERRDLGVIEMSKGGSLEIELEILGAVEPGNINVCFRPLEGGHPREGIVIANGVARADGIPPGPVEIDVSGKCIAMSEARVQVASGKTTKATLQVRPGGQRIVKLRNPKSGVPEFATWAIQNSEGVQVMDGRTRANAGELYRIYISLVPGTYTFTAKASTGEGLRETITIEAPEDDLTPLEFSFKE